MDFARLLCVCCLSLVLAAPAGFAASVPQPVFASLREQIDWYERAAQKGDVAAQYQVAQLYADDGSVYRNSIKARHWLREAAQQGHAQAAFELAQLYHNGQKTRPDFEQASYWYQQAARAQHAAAQINLAAMYETGQVDGSQDLTMAAHWYGQAAAQGSSEAQLRMGNLLIQQHGMAQGHLLAVEWFAAACDGGSDEGCELYEVLRGFIERSH